MKKKYPLSQSYLFKCHSKKKLADSLGMSLKKLKYISNNPRYYSFTKKTATKNREIDVPSDAELKKAQKKIYNYLKYTNRPNYLMAGEIGKNILSNAVFHKDSDYWLKFDISNFFPNCKREYIYRFFQSSMQCSPDVASILTNITVYRGGLVQGISTSMLLSFFAFTPMFDELSLLATKNNLKFSTYVDDFTFSSSSPINTNFIKLRVNKIVRAYGHTIKNRKVKYYSTNDFKRVSGVIVTKTHHLKVPNKNRKKIIALAKLMKENINTGNYQESEKIRLSLIGCINSARQIEPEIFPEISKFTKTKFKS